jgi:DNA-binding beta-propeller fold protein YncE
MVQTVSLSGVLSYPRGIKIDSEGNLYVADSGNNRICKIDVTGFITGVPGADLSSPSGVALDSAGTIYVASSGNHLIKKAMAGLLVNIAGDGTYGFADGTGTAARFYNPKDIVTDSVGNLYVADTENNRIRKITPAGVVSTIAGDGTQGANDGTGTAAQFNKPTGLAIDSAGAIYVADTRNHRIRKITPVYE